MNKAELVRALKKTTSTKKTMKRRKMKGGALTSQQIAGLVSRNLQEQPMNFFSTGVSNFGGPIIQLSQFISDILSVTFVNVNYGNSRSQTIHFNISKLSISDDGNTLILQPSTFGPPLTPTVRAPVPAPQV